MKIFISYAHVDEFVVKKMIVKILRSAGHDPWFDHNLMPGQDWKLQLLSAIKDSDAFLYALTPESVQSEWCMWEFNEAVKNKKKILPVLLRKTKLPDSIGKIQYVDFIDGPTGNAVAKLIGGLQALVIDEIPEISDDPDGLPTRAIENIEKLTRKYRLLPLFELAFNGLQLSHNIPTPNEIDNIVEYQSISLIFYSNINTVRFCAKQIFDEENYERISTMLKDTESVLRNIGDRRPIQAPKEEFNFLLDSAEAVEHFILGLQMTLSEKSLAAFSLGAILAEWINFNSYYYEYVEDKDTYSRFENEDFADLANLLIKDVKKIKKIQNEIENIKSEKHGNSRQVKKIYNLIRKQLLRHDLNTV